MSLEQVHSTPCEVSFLFCHRRGALLCSIAHPVREDHFLLRYPPPRLVHRWLFVHPLCCGASQALAHLEDCASCWRLGGIWLHVAHHSLEEEHSLVFVAAV